MALRNPWRPLPKRLASLAVYITATLTALAVPLANPATAAEIEDISSPDRVVEGEMELSVSQAPVFIPGPHSEGPSRG